jgi:hypothetical protein
MTRNQQPRNHQPVRGRGWWRRYWVVVILIVYFVLSLGYQATASFWRTRTIARADYQITDGTTRPSQTYHLAIHYPLKIPLEPSGVPGRPITLWVWCTDCASTHPARPLALDVAFQVLGDHVVFTDAEGEQRNTQFTVPVALSEPAAARVTAYVGRRRSGEAASTVSLTLNVLRDGQSLTVDPFSLTLGLERWWEAALRSAFDLILNTPALSWVSVAVAIYTLWRERRDARRQREAELRARISALPEVPKQRIWRRYWALWEEVEAEGLLGLHADLRQAWHEIDNRYPAYVWQHQMREWLTETLEDWLEHGQREAARVRLLELQEIQAISAEETAVLLELFGLREQEGEGDGASAEYQDIPLEKLNDRLQRQLEAFRILGLRSGDLMLEFLDVLDPISDALCELLWASWYREGGAAGRYLLRIAENLQLESDDGSMGDVFRAWVREEMPSPGTLWPEMLPELTEDEKRALAKLHPLEAEKGDDLAWYTPFGPMRAELEGRLPARDEDVELPNNLFWEGHPLKKEIWARRDGMFVAPPGSGRTTLMLMARHEYRFAGRYPALSLYLPVTALPGDETLFQQCRQVIFDVLMATLYEDPFWLLDTQTQCQAEVVGFLLARAGGHELLARRFNLHSLAAGVEEPAMREQRRADQNLLFELFYQYTAQDVPDWQALHALLRVVRVPLARARGSAPRSFPIFFWFDVQFDDPSQEQAFVDLIHTHTLLPHMGQVKIFLTAPLPNRELPQLGWSEDAIQELLDYRWHCVGLNMSNWQPLMEALNEPDPMARLSGQAQGSPKRLIQAGNRLLRRWGELL